MSTRLPGAALLCGILAQGALIALAVRLRASWPAWNIALVARLAGEPPVIGYTASGHAFREGTPAHLILALIGLAGGIAAYALLSYILLRMLGQGRQHE